MAASEMLVFVYVNKNSDIPRQIRQSLFLFYRFLSIKYLYTSKIKRSISNSILTMFIIKSIIHTTSDFYEGFKQTSLCQKNNCTPSKKQPPAIILMTFAIITKILLKYDFHNLSRQLYKSYLFIFISSLKALHTVPVLLLLFLQIPSFLHELLLC